MRKLVKRIKKMSLNSRVIMLAMVAVTVPSIIFSGIFFGYMQQNIIQSEQDNMTHLLTQQEVQIVKNIEAINIAERFFRGDEALVDFLEKGLNGEITIQEKLEFFQEDLKTLERMVNSNTYLNQIRIYIPHKNTQEMMPIIYYQDRMYALEWAQKEDYMGWQFGYTDQLFGGAMTQDPLMGHITMIQAPYTKEPLAIMEITMSMEMMFGNLYDDQEGRWISFTDQYGNKHGGGNIKGLEPVIQKLKDNNKLGTDYEVIGAQNFVVGYLPLEPLGGHLVMVTDMTTEMQQIRNTTVLFVVSMVVAFIIFIIAISYITRRMFDKFYRVLYSIQEIQKGNLSLVVDEDGDDEVSELGSQINKLSVQIKTLMDENVHRELLIKNSEIKALQNQINAHFIYNVLESIKMMAEIDEKYEISDATTALGKLLRYSMKWASSHVSVGEEIEYIKNYLKLINLRFDYEIQLSTNLSETILRQRLPKMSLQPLIENAIYHGVEDIAEDTTIYIKDILFEKDAIIEVTDMGKGMSEEAVEQLYQKIAGKIESSGGSGNGIGLKNVQDRIKMSFGENYGLDIMSKEECYTKIRVKIPITVDREENR